MDLASFSVVAGVASVFILEQRWSWRQVHPLAAQVLKTLDRVFRLHCVIVFLLTVVAILRQTYLKYIWNNSAFCKILGTSLMILSHSEQLAATAFSYFKIRVYQQLARRNEERTFLFFILKFSLLGWLFGLIPALIVVMAITGQSSGEWQGCINYST